MAQTGVGRSWSIAVLPGVLCSYGTTYQTVIALLSPDRLRRNASRSRCNRLSGGRPDITTLAPGATPPLATISGVSDRRSDQRSYGGPARRTACVRWESNPHIPCGIPGSGPGASSGFRHERGSGVSGYRTRAGAACRAALCTCTHPVGANARTRTGYLRRTGTAHGPSCFVGGVPSARFELAPAAFLALCLFRWATRANVAGGEEVPPATVSARPARPSSVPRA